MSVPATVILFLLCAALSADAQPTPPPAPRAAASPSTESDGEPPGRPETLGFSYDASFLQDLPLSDNLYSLLEHVQPSLISDRFTGGGLFTGQAARVGGFQASWTQTRFRIGDVDITDPTGSGAPLVLPDLSPWQRVQVATGLLGSDVNATGLAVTLVPESGAPGANGRWRSTAFASTSHGGLTGRASTLAQPTIARLGGRDRVAFGTAGPVTSRLTAMVNGAWTRASQFDRRESSSGVAEIGSAVGSLVYATEGGGQWQTVGMTQRSNVPSEYRLPHGSPSATTTDTSLHLQSTYAAPLDRPWPWRVFAAYTERGRTSDGLSPAATVERMVDGPVSAVAAPSPGTVRQWTAGARIRGTRHEHDRTHYLSAGFDAVGARQRTRASSLSSVGERTDGAPSRLWLFSNPSDDSLRRNLTVSVHIADTIPLSPRLRLSAGLRLESATGSAAGAAEGIDWLTLLPRARLDWRLHDGGATTFFVGYSRTAYRLALDLLAFGDPAAPTAALYRWSGGPALSAASGQLVARVGPGTGGRSDFVRIDPSLRRPVSDELALGFDLRPGPRTRFQIAMVGRREAGFIDLTNEGAPPTAYSRFSVEDPGANTGSPDDDKVIPVYARIPSTLGADRYLLTTSGEDPSLSGSLELSGQWSASRLTLYGGATASIAQGPASNLGYGALENDQSAIPDAYVSPNADTFNRGRLFNDRAFTVKLTGVYRLPWDTRLGAIARYQDGQSFSRVLVFPDLPQGAEAVRAFPAGDSRFRFIGTLDARLSKGFRVAGGTVDLVLDAYNLLNLTYDVEERAAQAPNVRTAIAIQPPRAAHVGVRVSF